MPSCVTQTQQRTATGSPAMASTTKDEEEKRGKKCVFSLSFVE
jgi:hypothetical protein